MARDRSGLKLIPGPAIVWWYKELDEVTVRIGQENLPRAIRALLLRLKRRTECCQMPFPRGEIVHLQRKMIAAASRADFPTTIADEMQFLLVAQPKPGAGKIEGRSGHRRQSENVFIESATPGHIGDVNGYVIEFVDCHGFWRTALQASRSIRQQSEPNEFPNG